MKTEALSRIITSFTLYKFLSALTTPFDRMEAYKRGIIDKRGNQIKPDEKLTQVDKMAFTDFDRLIISLRRLIMMVPDPYVTGNMNSVITALKLISEECEEIGGNKEVFVEGAIREMLACRLITEEMSASGAGNMMGGNFNTTTNMNTLDNPQGNLAGYDPPLATGKKIFRRRKPNKYYTDKNNSY